MGNNTSNGFIYMTIPAKYASIYHKLLVAMNNFGKDLLDDCGASCKGQNKKIINCWNMFQTACASYQLNTDASIKQADIIIKYVEAEMKLLYGGLGM
jgi:hypothetical protein